MGDNLSASAEFQARSRQRILGLLAGRPVCGAISILYGAILAGLPMSGFKDRENYLIYAGNSLEILHRYHADGWLSVLSNEPVWLLINIAFSSVMAPDNVLRTLIFLSATTVAYIVLRKCPLNFFWLCLVLLLPQVLKNHVVHIRQGVAIAIFLVGWFSPSLLRTIIFIGVTPFIHASFFVVCGLLCLILLARRLRFSRGLKTAIVLGTCLLISVSIVWVANILGARQAERYAFLHADVSGVGFAFWFIVLFQMLMQGRQYFRDNIFQIGFVGFYLSSYFFVPVSARILESVMIPVLISCFLMRGWSRLVFLGMFLSYFLLQYYSRLGMPWLGFGISG